MLPLRRARRPHGAQAEAHDLRVGQSHLTPCEKAESLEALGLARIPQRREDPCQRAEGGPDGFCTRNSLLAENPPVAVTLQGLRVSALRMAAVTRRRQTSE